MFSLTPGRAPAAGPRPHARLTAPEQATYAALARIVPGRFRCHAADLPGSPDLVLDDAATAVFVHGCFWHAHGCGLSRTPTTNRPFWEAKFTRNRARDAAALAALHRLGWQTIVVWECATRATTTTRLSEALAAALGAGHRHAEIAEVTGASAANACP